MSNKIKAKLTAMTRGALEVAEPEGIEILSVIQVSDGELQVRATEEGSGRTDYYRVKVTKVS